MRILLVEDNRRLHSALKEALQGAGYAVDAASDGPAGEAYAQAALYDAMILDVMLPGSGGHAAGRAPASSARRARSPIRIPGFSTSQ